MEGDLATSSYLNVWVYSLEKEIKIKEKKTNQKKKGKKGKDFIKQILLHLCANYSLIKENILPEYFSVSHQCTGFCVSLPSANCFVAVKCEVNEVSDTNMTALQFY